MSRTRAFQFLELLQHCLMLFVELLRKVISHFETSRRKSVHFSPFFDISEGEWSAEG